MRREEYIYEGVEDVSVAMKKTTKKRCILSLRAVLARVRVRACAE